MIMDDDASPLDPEQLDELVSADLDGALAGAAHDLGLSVDEARARLDATPGAAERRAALVTARDLLGRPPELDELTSTRLRAAALRGSDPDPAQRRVGRRSRGRRHSGAWVGGAAAAVAVVVAVGVGLAGRLGTGSSDSKSSAALAPASKGTPVPAPPGPTAAFGAFTDADALARAVVGRDVPRSSGAGQSASSTFKQAENGTTGDDQLSVTSTAAPQSSATAAVAAGAAAAAGTSTCTTPPPVPNGNSAVLRATATLSGAPVVVWLFRNKDRHVVVIEDTRCIVLSRETFG